MPMMVLPPLPYIADYGCLAAATTPAAISVVAN